MAEGQRLRPRYGPKLQKCSPHPQKLPQALPLLLEKRGLTPWGSVWPDVGVVRQAPEKGGLGIWNSREWAPEGIQELGGWGTGVQLPLILQARARGGVLPSASFSQSIGIRGGTTFHSVELSHAAVQGHPGNLGAKCQ